MGDPADACRAVAHPKFPAEPVAAAALVPPGWKVEGRLTGDLDGDRRAEISEGNFSNDRKKLRWITRPRRPPRTLSELGEAWEFEP